MSSVFVAKPAAISEIFTSLQGEGPHIGEPHIFVRFQDCNIHCEYCDELGKTGESMEVDEVCAKVKELEMNHGPHRFVSLTGGEPLFYVTFLECLLPKLKADGFRIYLETSGILPKALPHVIDWVDVVAMDIKLKSVTKEPRHYFEEHRGFLHISRQAPEVFVKMVVSPEVDEDEFLTGVRLIEAQDPNICLILQGVTPVRSLTVDEEIQKATLLSLQKLALRYLSDVRIIPRLHVAMGIR